MKKLIMLSICALTLCSCQRLSHNFNNVAIGKVWTLGVGGYGLTYVNGMLIIQAVRENSSTVIETNDGDGFTKDPSAISKGIRTIKFRTGPQITGYLKDLAKRDPKAAEAYIKAMVELNKEHWDSDKQKPIDVNIEDASKKAEEIVNPFECDGNCDLKDLWKNNSIAYQNAVAVKLLNYTDDKATFPESKTTFYHSLQSFITRLAKLTVRGRTVTQMRVKEVTIRDNQIKDMLFIMIEPDGNTFDTTCPECVMEDE